MGASMHLPQLQSVGNRSFSEDGPNGARCEDARMKIFAVLLLGLASAAAVAAPPATEFAGLVPGQKAKLDALRKSWRLDCNDSGLRCIGATSVEGTPAKAVLIVGEDGALDLLKLEFTPGEYARIAKAMESKYGAPKRIDSMPTRDMDGKQYAAESRQWEGPDGVVISMFQGTPRGSSLLRFSSPRYVADGKKWLQDTMKKR